MMNKKNKTKAPKIRLITARYLKEVTGGGLVPACKPDCPPPPPSCSQCTTFTTDY